MKINSLKGAVNLTRKLQAKVPEMTAKNGEKAKKLLKEFVVVLRDEAMAIFGDTFAE